MCRNPKESPDAGCRCCGSYRCFCCSGSLLADFWTWSPAACCCELISEPRSQNDATTCCCIQFCLCAALTFCFRVYAFMVVLQSIITPALDDFRVSLQPAQSESVNTVNSSASFPYSNTCLHCLSRFRYLASLFDLARLCWLGLDIFWHNSFTMNVMSARS